MSSYGPQDPQNPYGPSGAGQPGQPNPPYGQPYGQPQQPGYPPAWGGYGRPAPGGGYPLSSWGKRLGAYLLDSLLTFAVVLVPAGIGIVAFASGAETTVDQNGYTTSTVEGPAAAIGLIMFGITFLLSIGFTLWNLGIRQGRTGHSLAKGWLGMKVVGEATGQPIGVGAGIGRLLMHSFIDGAVCYLGFLWPLWDPRNRTWGDMVVGSVVVDAPKGAPAGPITRY